MLSFTKFLIVSGQRDSPKYADDNGREVDTHLAGRDLKRLSRVSQRELQNRLPRF